MGHNKMLSNLYKRPFTMTRKSGEKIKFESVEHAYQTLKSGTFDDITFSNPKWKQGGVKIRGRFKADSKTNVALMRKLMAQSFKQNPKALMALKATGYDAISLSGVQAGIKTDAVHGSARIADINTDRLRLELDRGRIVIVAGFQGLAESGDITTLGRGGSDTTAVALAVATEAERCEIYTDVEGIYTTDPRLTNQARKLAEIGFQEMLEMAVLGAKMNPRSIELGAVYEMPVYVASSFSNEPGTLIHGGEHTMEVRKAVTGIAVDRNVGKITVRGVIDRPGVAAGLLQPLADAGISVDVIVQNASSDGTTDFTFTVAEANVNQAADVLGANSKVQHTEIVEGSNLAKVSIVGTGMENAPGYAAKMFSTLAGIGANIDMITTSEIRITTIINKDQVQKAVQALHDAFELEKSE